MQSTSLKGVTIWLKWEPALWQLRPPQELSEGMQEERKSQRSPRVICPIFSETRQVGHPRPNVSSSIHRLWSPRGREHPCVGSIAFCRGKYETEKAGYPSRRSWFL